MCFHRCTVSRKGEERDRQGIWGDRTVGQGRWEKEGEAVANHLLETHSCLQLLVQVPAVMWRRVAAPYWSGSEGAGHKAELEDLMAAWRQLA